MQGVRAVARAVALVLLVAGCAIKEVPYDREMAGGIERIGMVTPRFPGGPVILLASSPAQSFGLIGALVTVGVMEDRKARFQAVMQGQNFTADDALAQTFGAALEARGYKVSRVATRREKADFLTEYPTDRGDKVDAYLDLVVLNYGYMSAGIGSDQPWRPSYTIRVRLVRARDSSVLMQDTLVYNPLGTPKEVVTIAPDPAYRYDNFDTLEKDPEGAVKALRAAFEEGAKTLGTMLK